jgi:hypothetical protein
MYRNECLVEKAREETEEEKTLKERRERERRFQVEMASEIRRRAHSWSA